MSVVRRMPTENPSNRKPECSLDEESTRKAQQGPAESQQSLVQFTGESDIASCASDTDDGDYETSSEGPLKNSQSKQSDIGRRRTESSTSESSEPMEKSSVCCLTANTDSAEGTLVNSPTQGSATLIAMHSNFTVGKFFSYESPRFGKSKSTSALKRLGPMERLEENTGNMSLSLIADSFAREKKMKVVVDFLPGESSYTMDVSTNTSRGDMENEGPIMPEIQTKSRYRRKEVKCDIRITESQDTNELKKKPDVTNDLKALLRIDGELGPLRRQLNEISGMFKALHQTGFTMDIQTQPLSRTGFGPSRTCQDLPYLITKSHVVQEEEPNTRSLGDGQSFLPPDSEASFPIDGSVCPRRKIQDTFAHSSTNPSSDINGRKARGQSTGRTDREKSSWQSQRSTEPETRERLSRPYQDSDYEGERIELDRRVPSHSGLCRSCRRRSGRNSFSPGKFFDFRSPPTPLGGSEGNKAGLHGARHPGGAKKTLTRQEKRYPSSSPRWNDLTLGYRTSNRTQPHASRNHMKPREILCKNNHTSSESCTHSFRSSTKTGDSPVMVDGMCSGISSITGRTTSANPTPRNKKRYTNKGVSPITSFVQERERHICRRTDKFHKDHGTPGVLRTLKPPTDERTRGENGHCHHGVRSWVMRNEKGVPVKAKYRVPVGASEISGSKTDLKVQRSGFSLKCDDEQLVFEASLETLLKSSHSKDRLDCKSSRHSDQKANDRSYKFIVVPVVFTNGVPELSKTRLLNVSKFSSVKHILSKCSHKMLKLEDSSHNKSSMKHPETLTKIPSRLQEGQGVETFEHRVPTSFHSSSCPRHGRSLEKEKWSKQDRTKCPKAPQASSPYARKTSQCSEADTEKERKVVPGLRCSPEDFLYDT